MTIGNTTISTATPQTPRQLPSPATITPALVIWFFGVFARAIMLRWGGRMPGYNGQYSPVQVRSLLENGALGMPDYPLMFLIHAAVAWIIRAVTGLPLDTAIIVAVKLCVALLPPLIALPAFLVCRQLCIHAGKPASRIPLLAAALAALGSPFMLMTGNLDKNALAIVWLGALLAAVYVYMDRRSHASLAVLTLFLGILGLSHVATFGAGVLIILCILTLHALLPGAPPLRQTLSHAAVLAATIAITQIIVFWKFDPARIGRLVGAATNPIHFVTSDDLVAQGTLLTPDAPHIIIALVKLVIVIAACVIIFRAVRRQRTLMPRADVALITGCTLGAVALTGPWVNNDNAPRLLLIACVPILIVGMFLLIHTSHTTIRRLIIACCVLFIIFPGIFNAINGGWRVLSNEAYAELQTAAPRIANPDKTLVVSMHGTEWDTAWLLHTNVAHLSAIDTNDWQRYDQVLYLTATGRVPKAGLFGRAIGMGKVATGKDGRRVLEVGPFARIPFIEIPTGAEPVLDGQFITLARVKSPPPGIPASR